MNHDQSMELREVGHTTRTLSVEVRNQKRVSWRELELSLSGASDLEKYMTELLHRQLFDKIIELSAGRPCTISLGPLTRTRALPLHADDYDELIGKRDLLLERRAIVEIIDENR